MRVRGFIGTLNVVYVAICVLVLALVLLCDWSTPAANREPNIGLFLIMSALTFPGGAAAVSFIGNHAAALLPNLESRTLEALNVWFIMFSVGWLQWFVLIGWPVARLLAWYRARHVSA